MGVELNHTIVWCRDKAISSAFLARILGLPAPAQFHHFLVVTLTNGVSLDFMEKEGEVARQHYAFLVGEEEFDAAMGRISAEGLTFWADPARSLAGEINAHFGGRGAYFEDPNGHLLEIMTRPYGSEADG
jgi:catechol 2,3-dioxygenase-like lactoylglutathione lyase family enzyme